MTGFQEDLLKLLEDIKKNLNYFIKDFRRFICYFLGHKLTKFKKRLQYDSYDEYYYEQDCLRCDYCRIEQDNTMINPEDIDNG